MRVRGLWIWYFDNDNGCDDVDRVGFLDTSRIAFCKVERLSLTLLLFYLIINCFSCHRTTSIIGIYSGWKAPAGVSQSLASIVAIDWSESRYLSGSLRSRKRVAR